MIVTRQSLDRAEAIDLLRPVLERRARQIGAHLGAARARRLDVPAFQKRDRVIEIIEPVERREAAGRSVDQLAQEENRVLIGLLKLREETGLNKVSAEPMAAV